MTAALKHSARYADDGPDMRRCAHNELSPRKQRWVAIASRWIEMVWGCRCQYTNIATLRCRGCGARPPKALRADVAASVSRMEHGG